MVILPLNTGLKYFFLCRFTFYSEQRTISVPSCLRYRLIGDKLTLVSRFLIAAAVRKKGPDCHRTRGTLGNTTGGKVLLTANCDVFSLDRTSRSLSTTQFITED